MLIKALVALLRSAAQVTLQNRLNYLQDISVTRVMLTIPQKSIEG